MRNLYPIATLCLALTSSAQIWCPPSATWTNTFSNGWTMDGFARFTYSGDTIIAALPAQKILMHVEGSLLGTPTTWDLGPYFTTVDGSLVRIWTAAGFDTLYHFGAVPGDHWNHTLEDGTDSMIPLMITDTGTATIDGVPLHFLVTADGDTIMERLGSLHHVMLPWIPFTLDAPDGPLRCYHDLDIDHIVPGWAFGCDTWTEIPAPSSNTSPAIVLGDGTSGPRIRIPDAIPGMTIQVHDMAGRTWFSSVVGTGDVPLPLNACHPGLHGYALIDGSGMVLQTGRWLVLH